jgi:hypothetical protein
MGAYSYLPRESSSPFDAPEPAPSPVFANPGTLPSTQAGGDFSALGGTPEHLDVGGDRKITLDLGGEKIKVTTGEVNALADFVGSVTELYAMDPEVLMPILAVIRHNPHADDAEWSKVVPNYAELTLKNEAHFGTRDDLVNGGDGGPNNVDSWETGHYAALDLAVQSSQTGDKAPRRRLTSRRPCSKATDVRC